ncbi:hypothetical protein SUNDANCE_100 [Brevibacillus phage Sundance]|uniref:hypothetical protein n=1 Tax=Brevibacillus phage Sundance TaxID=1691958 RepID=UPI0006BDD0E7|nr:hypothetical protein AVT09_gp100 [Brevibacillus phage Sundance]ALA47916.1 hypothetical protein SUNDANCE_100 [Brevibacillus phage Sundance]
MYSSIVLFMLFLIALISIWLLLINMKVHDKAIEKTKQFKKNNFGNDKGENV